MTIRNLDLLFSPSSIALIGASPQAGSVGRIVASNLRTGGFAGDVWLVNPRHQSIDGAPCFASVSALPRAPELAVVATPPQTSPGVIADLARHGTRAAVVITAGLDRDLRTRMLEAARPTCLRILGPNCIGLILPRLGINASFAHCMPLKGDLAFLSQSGALVTAVIDWANGRGIGFSKVVSMGEMADVDFGDTLDYLAGDPESRAILLYVEQVTHAAKFMSAARRAARVKPVIVLKSGRHEAGAKAAASHTGALSGSDAVYNAAFRRAGLVRVNDLDGLFEAAEMLSFTPHLVGERLAILTNGGGAGVLAADRLEDYDGTLAEIAPTTMQALNAALPATWSKGNPIDIIGDAGPDRYEAAMKILLEDPASDAVLVINCPTALASSEEAAAAVLKAVAGASERWPKKPVLTNWLGDGAAAESRRRFAEARIPSFETPASAIDGFMQLVRYRRSQDELMRTPPAGPKEAVFDRDRAREVIVGALKRGQPMLTEFEAKAVLMAYGVPVAETIFCADADTVTARAEEILTRYRACVIKIHSDDISHKSDVGGVRLGIMSADEAREVARSMAAEIQRVRPDARLDGWVVEPMIERPGAHELIVGMSEDATFGPTILFGAGGVAVEVIKDTAHALPPLDGGLARDLMRQTRIHRLLVGYRNRPAADLDAIADVLVRVSALVGDLPELRELDINPLIADDKGCIALDARMRVADPALSPRRPMSIRPYPSAWEKDVTLPKLGPVHVRPIRPEDEALYEQFFANVTAEDMHMRFFTAKPDRSHRFVARLTQIDYAREMAFVALSEAGDKLLGVARLSADPDYTRAEYAVLVRSDLKGKGLGWLLMQHLIAYAREEGLGTLFGQMLATNTTMIEMCRALNFSVEPDPDDQTLRRATLPLGSVPALQGRPG
ncbi:bifunctional acetate--CoA ligase family protein/GNAT family N-acetyltransferase [Hyphomicrobium sp.]|uniref:bifunctional acetate--CoA ligase family protein/GNAT family N-acetyltransferase n=1 Tax=Hyphomicrobium sp. TaxID=82 RepID=UPI0025BC9078|nr:bifunctional acetate--CoA ligase family protein/GNAT family N-acetyltransferase [Hyphomicrobium sp.]MCC7253854.1 bifunctional acetate--CoA ligase family protein/GNAT family N-acetyltransferase [Hyphomicrobium sp.]